MKLIILFRYDKGTKIKHLLGVFESMTQIQSHFVYDVRVDQSLMYETVTLNELMEVKYIQ